MRDDGVFVGEDCPAFVYLDGNKAAYPDGWFIGMQLPHEYAAFIATFDPEHVALIEAVVEAAENSALYDEGATAFGKSRPLALDELHRRVDALAAYRKERAL